MKYVFICSNINITEVTNVSDNITTLFVYVMTRNTIFFLVISVYFMNSATNFILNDPFSEIESVRVFRQK